MSPVAHPGASYGWRARIGVLQPSLVADNNTYEFYLMAPGGVQLVLTSLGMIERSQRAADAAERALDNIEEPVQRLLNRGVDVIVQAGIPLVTRNGRAYESVLQERVRRMTSVPLALDVRSSIEAMKALRLTRIALIATFSEEQLKGIAGYLEEDGIDVVALRSIQGAGGDDQGTVSLSVPYRETVALLQSARRAQGVWLPGASLPTVGLIQTLEDNTGAAVATSAQAMMWHALRLAGVSTQAVAGYGKLFGTT